MLDFLSDFKSYYELVFFIAALIVTVGGLIYKRQKNTTPGKEDLGDHVEVKSKIQSAQSNNGYTIQGNNNNIYTSTSNSNDNNNKNKEVDNITPSNINNKSEIKQNKRILFIDDNFYPITKLMRKNDWKHVEHIEHIDNFDCDIVKNADVILVDVIGVGINLGFQDQGFGLAGALKDIYPEKKIILYSQEKNKFHKVIKEVDLVLEKTTSIYSLEKEILSLFGVN